MSSFYFLVLTKYLVGSAKPVEINAIRSWLSRARLVLPKAVASFTAFVALAKLAKHDGLVELGLLQMKPRGSN